MPLRDHFRPPVASRHSWDELHGQWPAMMVLGLTSILPEGYVAAPTVHLGSPFEIDVSAYETDGATDPQPFNGNGSLQLAPSPTLTVEAELPVQDEYEVRVYDTRHGRTLVAAVELVSPSNKDRPESRQVFIGKVAALLHQDVCVSIVDVVTVRHFNLYADLLDLIGQTDPAFGGEPPHIYSVTIRNIKRLGRRRPRIETWFYPLALGQPLPPLPIWLDLDLHVSLDLEGSYEETCRALRIA